MMPSGCASIPVVDQLALMMPPPAETDTCRPWHKKSDGCNEQRHQPYDSQNRSARRSLRVQIGLGAVTGAVGVLTGAA